MIDLQFVRFGIYNPESNTVLAYGVVEDDKDEEGCMYVRAEWVDDFNRVYNFSVSDWTHIMEIVRNPDSYTFNVVDFHLQMAMFFAKLDHSKLLAVPIMASGLIFTEAEWLEILL